MLILGEKVKKTARWLQRILNIATRLKTKTNTCFRLTDCASVRAPSARLPLFSQMRQFFIDWQKKWILMAVRSP